MARETDGIMGQGDGEAEDSVIPSLAVQGNIPCLIEACSTEELRCARDSTPYRYAAVHLLGLLLIRDLEGARFLWRRLPASAREESDVSAAWGLGRMLWQKDRCAFYTNAAGHSWDSLCASLVVRLVQRVRGDAFALLCRAYSAIGLAKAASFLGLSVDETLTECISAGWKVEDEFLLPCAVESLPVSSTGVVARALAEAAEVTTVACAAVTTAAGGHMEARGDASIMERSQRRSSRPTVEQSLQALASLTEQLVRLQTT